jgi:hypothetical protein
MSEPMTVHFEVWPVAADEQGLWLVSGADAWRQGLPIAADNDVHVEVETELSRQGVLDDVVLLHSTSWRQDTWGLMLTYAAVLRRLGFVRENWPEAEPISSRLPAMVGTPLTHGAAEPPMPRRVDVLHHLLRHIAFLRENDGTAGAVLDEHWRRHLADFAPALATMYSAVHRAA